MSDSALDKAKVLWEQNAYQTQSGGWYYLYQSHHPIILLWKPRLQRSANLILPKPQDWKTDVSGFKTLGFWVQSLCTFKYSKLPLEIKNASISDLTAIALIWSFFFRSGKSIMYLSYASFGLCSGNTRVKNNWSRTYFWGAYVSSKREWLR